MSATTKTIEENEAAAHMAYAMSDVVIVQLVYFLIQFVPPQNEPDTSFHQKLYGVTDDIRDKAHP